MMRLAVSQLFLGSVFILCAKPDECRIPGVLKVLVSLGSSVKLILMHETLFGVHLCLKS